MFRGSVGPPWPTGFTSLFAHHIVERLPLADVLITAARVSKRSAFHFV